MIEYVHIRIKLKYLHMQITSRNIHFYLVYAQLDMDHQKWVFGVCLKRCIVGLAEQVR
jgi:hypothetical protein